MATLRDIRQRIASVKNTQKITKAMKMVAAAKFRRAQNAILQARPYSKKMSELLRHLTGTVDAAASSAGDLFVHREVRSVAIVVVSADRGMCGAFNSNVVRSAVNHIDQRYAELLASGRVKLVCVGKKGFDFFTKRHYSITGKHTGVFQSLTFASAKEIVRKLVDGYRRGEYDRIEIVYNEFKNAAQQRLTIEQFLPVLPVDTTGNPSHQKTTDYIYEPSSSEIIADLVPKHLNFQMWRIMLDSFAAEQGARMTAMENATTNAKELIRVLQLNYNKARQASITKELLEIVAGADALKKAG